MKSLLLGLLLASALAQDPSLGDPSLDALGPPGPPPQTELQLDEQTERISKGLRCPVCQGMSIADSPSQTAVTWKNAVRDMVSKGYSRAQVEQFFITRHSEWVLLQPPAHGLNWLLWLSPALVLGGGLTLAAAYASRWRREPDSALPSERGDVPKDPYEAALLAELEES